MKNKVILYGGSFDPIHIGHKRVVQSLMKNYPEAKIIVMTSQNRLKNNSLIPIEERIKSVKEVFAGFSNVEVVDWTLFWDTSSTFEVYKKMCLDYPDYDCYVAAGEDILASLPLWKNFEGLCKEVNWVILSRHKREIINSVTHELIIELIKRTDVLDINFPDVSSTEIKKRYPNSRHLIPEESLPFLEKYFK